KPPDSNGGRAPAARSHEGLARAITDAAAALDATLVIILDQFEEHFSYRVGRADQDRLADELADCINSAHVPANFLIAVREDAYGGLGDLFRGRIPNIYSNYLHLEYLTRDAAREAIEQPVELHNAARGDAPAVTLEPMLTEAVLDDVRRGRLELGRARADRNDGGTLNGGADAIETPFLQLVMTRLWDCELAQHSHVLRKVTLDRELGGAETIVRNHVDRALAGLSGAELEAATDIFRDLVTPSGVKVAHTSDDLAHMTDHPPATVAQILHRLYEERIVRGVDPAPGTTEPRYEIFHDRLVMPILDWRDQRENARLESARHTAELEAGMQRTQARRYRRRARIMLALAVSLLALLVTVLVLLQYARDQTAAAGRAKHTALRDTAEATYFGLTSRAESQLASRPDVSLLLDLAAYSQRAREAGERTPRPPLQAVERNLIATLQAVERSGAVGILHGHTDAVESIAFSPSGRTLASASSDKTIRLWRLTRAGHHPLGAPLRGSGPQYSVAFAPDGRLLASGSFNDVVLWNIAGHTSQAVVPFAGGAVTSVAFSRGGHLLAAGGSNGTVLLFNDASHSRMRISVPGAHPVRSVAFSPSGDELAISSLGGVVLWDLVHHHKLAWLGTRPDTAIYSVAFSRSGTRVAAGGTGPTAVWRLAAPHRPPALLGGGTIINSVAFSPDGRTLAAGGRDGTTALWDLRHDRRLGAALTGHQGAVYSIAFNPSGTTLASAGADRTIALWNYPVPPRFGQPLVNLPSRVHAVAISPDSHLVAAGTTGGGVFLVNRSMRRRPPPMIQKGSGQVEQMAFDPGANILAAAYADGAIRLWNLRNRRPFGRPLVGHSGPAFSVAFNPAGTDLVSGGADGTVRLWDVRTGKERGRPMRGDSGVVYAVAFSPDGREIVSGGTGRAVRMWSAGTRLPLHPPLIPQEDAIFSLAFAARTNVLASGGAGDAVHLWSLAGRAPVALRTLTGHSNYIRSLAFSPDGGVLASGSTDNTIRLWDVATGIALGGPLTGHEQSVESVAFSQNGRFIASGGSDRTVRLWQGIVLPPTFARLSAEVCGFLGAGLSRGEWSQYAPNIPFQRTCAQTAPG
ncbi:MAG: WD40 repeat domain-containing protein, partial [Solirubrobacteraceae bacterium]